MSQGECAIVRNIYIVHQRLRAAHIHFRTIYYSCNLFIMNALSPGWLVCGSHFSLTSYACAVVIDTIAVDYCPDPHVLAASDSSQYQDTVAPLPRLCLRPAANPNRLTMDFSLST